MHADTLPLEQDVDSTGAASYPAWWELGPALSLTISNMTVEPGDHMHASISEVVPDSDVWTISIQDMTCGESFSQTVPYSSTHATAEWIEETPLEIGTNAALPRSPPDESGDHVGHRQRRLGWSERVR
jgi:Peptidase A4 family